jgi:hypothetical protein
MKQIEVIVYKQGGNWISNIDGYISQLHYSVITKKDVLIFFEDKSECDNVNYIVKFSE